jgi:hypothetical protein
MEMARVFFMLNIFCGGVDGSYRKNLVTAP